MIRVLTLLDDFGSSDEYVSSVKARVLSINEKAEVVDISHEIPAYDVLSGASLLMAACGAFSRAIHIAVVDPGVGSKRRALALRTATGSWLVGPDNGILLPAGDRLGGIVEAYEIKPEYFAWWEVSDTFHGRDIFAPAAAFISLDEDATIVGDPIEIESLREAPFKIPRVEGNEAEVTIIGIDRFGSLRLSICRGCWPEFDGAERIETVIKGDSYMLPIKKTFFEVEKGKLFVYLDSSSFYGIAANQAEAAKIMDAKPGEKIKLRLV